MKRKDRLHIFDIMIYKSLMFHDMYKIQILLYKSLNNNPYPHYLIRNFELSHNKMFSFLSIIEQHIDTDR